MHRRFPASVLASLTVSLVVAAAPTPAAADDEPLNLLFFGNSFTMYNLQAYNSGAPLVPDRVGRLAVADGYAAPFIVSDLEGSTELDRHINRVAQAPGSNVNHPAMADRTWDFVVAQGHSQEATRLRDSEDFIADALTLHTAIRDHPSGRGAGVRTVLFQTWARAARHADYPANFASPAVMQAEIRENYERAAANINGNAGLGSALIAPVGDAFEVLDFAHAAPLDLYTGDHRHASVTGSLLASMVIYRTIYNEEVSDIAWSPQVSSWAGVNETTWNALTAAADSVVVPEPAAATTMIGAMILPLLGRRRRQ